MASASRTNKQDQASEAKDRSITIEVNNKPVRLEDKHVTGLEIKQAAIAQGVEIELDFILVEETKHGSRNVGDHEEITVKKDSIFTANASDDNS
jgi:prophage tail gpP-like protein